MSITTPTWEIRQGDVLERLREMPDESVHCVVTSPPYWGLRDYGTAQWEGGSDTCDHLEPQGGSGQASAKQNTSVGSQVMQYKDKCLKCFATRSDSQLGLEPTPEAYVAKMVAVFREVWRVLRSDGTCWVNLGDSYARAGGWSNNNGLDNVSRDECTRARTNAPDGVNSQRLAAGLKEKDLVGIPWMTAFALRQPYYAGRIKDERLRYWLSGLVDGEGCLTILETTSPHGSGNSFPPVLQVRMCDLAPVSRCAEITGLGCGSPEQNPPSQGGQRGSYQWRLSARNAADIAAELYPYLMVKKRQALVIWNHQKVRDSYETKKGVRIPADALEKQKRLREIVQALNANQPVDLPPWLEEPPSLHEKGWYLRSDVIWSKPNPMPESVTDRPTKSHEYVFLLSKSARYYYDADAIREQAETFNGFRGSVGVKSGANGDRNDGGRANIASDYMGRNARSVWNIATQPFAEAHFATFPERLVDRCISAGTSEKGVCGECGKPWARKVERVEGVIHKREPAYAPYSHHTKVDSTGWQPTTRATDQWDRQCSHDGLPVPATVLDIFSGSGTSGVAAHRLGRNYIGIELNPQYVAMSQQRLGGMVYQSSLF